MMVENKHAGQRASAHSHSRLNALCLMHMISMHTMVRKRAARVGLAKLPIVPANLSGRSQDIVTILAEEKAC